MAVRSLWRRRAASLPSSLPPRAPPPASLRQAELKRRRVQFERDLLLLAQGDSSEWRSQVPAHTRTWLVIRPPAAQACCALAPASAALPRACAQMQALCTRGGKGSTALAELERAHELRLKMDEKRMALGTSKAIARTLAQAQQASSEAEARRQAQRDEIG